jgi:serine/threonine protein kinase
MTAAASLSAALADRYRIERELGAGGMATVYLARDLEHERDVALKVLRPELAAPSSRAPTSWTNPTCPRRPPTPTMT